MERTKMIALTKNRRQRILKTQPRTEMQNNNQAFAGPTFLCCQCGKSCSANPVSETITGEARKSQKSYVAAPSMPFG